MSTTFWEHARKEFPDLLRLALPVVAGEIGWSLMTTVDTIIVGPLGAGALAAVSLGAAANIILVISGIGLLLGLDTLVSQAFGARDYEDCNHSLIQGIWIAVLLAVPMTLLQRNLDPAFALMRINPEVRVLAQPYMLALSWGMLPVFLYAALRRYLQSQSIVRPVMISLLSANIVNAIADWVLVYGVSGWIPAMGAEGAGWATTISRAYMALVLAVALIEK
jgi:MATE family multidrug resistance protein